MSTPAQPRHNTTSPEPCISGQPKRSLTWDWELRKLLPTTPFLVPSPSAIQICFGSPSASLSCFSAMLLFAPCAHPTRRHNRAKRMARCSVVGAQHAAPLLGRPVPTSGFFWAFGCLLRSQPQFPLNVYPASNGSLPSTRRTFTELLME